MTLALVSPASNLIQVSIPSAGFGEEKTILRTPWPHVGSLYPPYLSVRTAVIEWGDIVRTEPKRTLSVYQSKI